MDAITVQYEDLEALIHDASKALHAIKRRAVGSSLENEAAEACKKIEHLKQTHIQEQHAKSYPSGVIIDDEPQIGEYWAMLYPSLNLKFLELEDAEDFLMLSHQWKKNTPIFIDWFLPDKTNRKIHILRLIELGFTNIFIISSGDFSQKYLNLPIFVPVVDKNEPNKSIFRP